ncbi:MAG: hypothetical protein ACAI44_14355 [Candidatus Sericytochromatia bacterium]
MPSAVADALETDLEASLDAHVAAYRQAPLPRASLDALAVRAMETARDELQALCEDITTRLRELDRRAEHETGKLHLNFEPLLQRLRLCDEALRMSAVFAQLAARLDAEVKEVKQACLALAKQFLPNNLPLFEQGLEQFQDRCDQVADQLDAIEAQGHDIAPLVRTYEVWIALIENFSEILDERTEALRPR